MKQQIPNIITLTRVPMSVALLFILPLLLQLENIKVPSLILTCLIVLTAKFHIFAKYTNKRRA